MSAAAAPLVWSVAGSDSGGGAGLQADLRAFDAFGLHGCTAVAALTAQNSVAVERIEAVDPSMLDAQLAALAHDMPPAAIKLGMLGSAANAAVVAGWVDRLRARDPDLALVVDPVLRASTGASFAGESLMRAYRELLLPRATLLTPNRAEAQALLGGELRVDGLAGACRAARRLRAAGAGAVVVTGGDDGGADSVDWLDSALAEGALGLPRVATQHNHGTGCVFAASAAAALALGFAAPDAAVLAKMATTRALQHAGPAGAGAGPVRPREGFALAPGGLPTLHAPGMGWPQGPFAALAQPAMGLYAVVDSAAWVQRVLEAGVRTVQLRIKQGDAQALRQQVRESVAAARAAGAQLFINDHWQLAMEEGAYGVHLGQEDLAGADLPALQAAGLRLGISTHAPWEVARALALQPSYLACGPVHATNAKAMPWRPQGEGNLRWWCSVLDRPVVAIGGIDAPRAEAAARCGAAGVAVIRAVTGAGDTAGVVAALQQAIARGAAQHPPAPPLLPRSTLSPRAARAHGLPGMTATTTPGSD
ncbi:MULTISPECIES: bifunctional hydroxymethylpyrimidine kinase/phosphomethylpyrimidine kinase [Ramlibacter]|uniref:hydroxymethylpyrimidine kinase n=1 Tax=Ramlibacter aquaticus TaxID=2780094 RepID=A0ABR9SHP8_9BURK|nr:MULTISPECIES: bifunctional hydroxymethylpyrimidine kinase/phosphomethylpyrimidine kinase [Ramlibacter]MBE7941874.1 bifunctional hydroxymethylpyrimidine kinase/phosphomethylpyrimidine kinase [Ramlibacter aquaticus]